MRKLCKQCGTPVDSKKKLYCSNKCKDRAKWLRVRVVRQFSPVKCICMFCEKEFFSKSYRKPLGAKYCSGNCRRNHWRKLNPEMNKAQAARSVLNRKNDPLKYLIHKEKVSLANKTPERKYGHYRCQAKIRKISFDITFDEFMSFWDKPCTYCGESISGIGIDRIDNSKGYEKRNTVSCCITCNNMKKVLSKDIFLQKCKQITAHQASV